MWWQNARDVDTKMFIWLIWLCPINKSLCCLIDVTISTWLMSLHPGNNKSLLFPADSSQSHHSVIFLIMHLFVVFSLAVFSIITRSIYSWGLSSVCVLLVFDISFLRYSSADMVWLSDVCLFWWLCIQSFHSYFVASLPLVLSSVPHYSSMHP